MEGRLAILGARDRRGSAELLSTFRGKDPMLLDDRWHKAASGQTPTPVLSIAFYHPFIVNDSSGAAVNISGKPKGHGSHYEDPGTAQKIIHYS